MNFCLPKEFKDMAEASIGKEAFACFCRKFESEAGRGVVSVRVNPSKQSSYLSDMLARNMAEKVQWCSNGYYLGERPSFTLDPLFHSGAYYVQEACSMYMELAFSAIAAACKKDTCNIFSKAAPCNDVCETVEKKTCEIPCETETTSRTSRETVGKIARETTCEITHYTANKIIGEYDLFNNLNVLDLCAAPGGKSTHLLSLLGKDSVLVSNEVIRSRAVILADNIAKWGACNAVVTNNDPSDFKAFEGYFDIIVADAPCSGEGLFIKEPQAINEWSTANVNLCAQRQQRILADIWPALKPGGFLIYSTCTYNKFENDGNVSFLENTFGAEVIDIPLPPDSGIITTPKGGIQFVPGLVKGEGQFMAVVRKPFGESRGKSGKTGCRKHSADKVQFEKGCNYLPKNYTLLAVGELVKGYRKELFEQIRFIEKNLKCLLSGIAVANKKGKDYIPHADFALQQIVADMIAENRLPEEIHTIEVGRDDALKFLAKEQLLLKDAPLGFILLTYNGFGLGFVKNMGTRTNNLLPMARRIKMNIR